MSVENAHRFLRAARADPGPVRALGPDPALADLVALGDGFDADDLRAAYRQDWALRALATNGSATGNRDASARASVG